MKLAVLGYGSIAKRHLENLAARLPGARALVLRGGSEPLEPAHSWAGQARTLEEVLAFAPDLAVVASPASVHVEQATALALAGAHLLIEKPLALGLAGVRELIAICEAKGLTLLVGYNMAYLRPLAELADIAASGAIGQVLSLRADVGQYLPDWRPRADYRRTVSASEELGGGVLFELSHEIEYADRLIGGTARVFCASHNTGLLDVDVQDCADLMLQNARGAVASVHMNMTQKAPRRSCFVTGSEGVLGLDFAEGIIRLRRSGGVKWRVVSDCSAAGGAESYIAEADDFLACVRSGAEPRCGGRRGARVLELILAARQSALEGKAICA